MATKDFIHSYGKTQATEGAMWLATVAVAGGPGRQRGIRSNSRVKGGRIESLILITGCGGAKSIFYKLSNCSSTEKKQLEAVTGLLQENVW